jgi:hypothetical protein
MSEIDMTGMSLKQNELWQKRVLDLCKSKHFKVVIKMDRSLKDGITTEEYDRMQPKLEMIEKFASAMAAGMLKGTIKYPTDDWKQDWIPNMLGEQADAVNYILLTLDDMKKRGKL